MSKFAHIAKSVPTRKFQETAVWRPPVWAGNVAPPELILVRPTDTSKMFARAVMNPRIKGPKSRKDGKVRENDLVLGKRKRLLSYVIGCVVGWDNVFVTDSAGAVVKAPYVKIKDAEPSDPGVMEVVELLEALGDEAVSDFISFCGDPDNWIEDEDDKDEEPDSAVPLVKH